MSTTSGTMKSFKVTDKDGNVYVMIPVDTEARQAIDEAKNLEFDDDYFTSEVSQDQTTVNVGLNGVPLGVDSDSPLKFKQDNAQGIVLGSDAPFATAIAPEYSATATYAVGDHCMHLGKYYECNTAISTAEAWNSSHWTEVNVNSLVGSDVEIVNVGDYASNTSDLFNYLSALYSVGKTAILRYSYAMYNSDYVVGYGLGWSPYGSLYQIKAFSNVYAGTVNILTIDSSGYSFEQQYIGRLTELTDATESDLDNNAISMGDNVVQRLTLTTISTLTVNIGSAGNFALEIDNTGNSNDVTVSVVRSGTTTLKYSVAGGNTVGAGKYMQLTCVGSCWTLAEFTVPTP